jgi:AmpD protein
MINSNGWYSLAQSEPSPNQDNRPDIENISLLVIHSISLPPENFDNGYICDFFMNNLDPSLDPYFKKIANLRVSAHLLIDREGGFIQFVSFNDRAWHAGASIYNGLTNCNDFSIGIELVGSDSKPYTDAQYESLIKVTQEIIKRYPLIDKNRITGHSDIAPSRKTDPGPCFDWERYTLHFDDKD